MKTSRNTGLLLAAAIGGGLYWASKQPGGIRGTMDRLNGKIKEVADSENPLATMRGKFDTWQHQRQHQAAIEPMPMDSSPAI